MDWGIDNPIEMKINFIFCANIAQKRCIINLTSEDVLAEDVLDE